MYQTVFTFSFFQRNVFHRNNFINIKEGCASQPKEHAGTWQPFLPGGGTSARRSGGQQPLRLRFELELSASVFIGALLKMWGA